MKKKQSWRMWTITINGEPIEIAAYTRKGAVAQFMDSETSWTWKDYQRSGYRAERVMVMPEINRGKRA